MVHRRLTAMEAVALAVRSEIESTHLYGRLAERVKNTAVRDVLLELQADEEKHQEHLMALYRKMLGGQEPSIPAGDGREKDVKLDPEASYVEVITAARDKERSSEEFYKRAAETVLDYKTRMFFLDVAEQERHHASALQSLLDQLQEDPLCFDREDMDPFKGLHVGP